MIPNVMYRLEMPEPLSSDRSILRLHNTAVKDSLRKELENHHRRRIPGHFTTEARSKYRHMQRSPATKAIKMRRFRSRTDLVATGRTKRAMLSQYRISVSGNASSGDGVVGTLKMRFPFPGSFANSTNRVSLEQMAKEIGSLTQEEAGEVRTSFKTNYIAQVNDRLARSPRLRKRIGA